MTTTATDIQPAMTQPELIQARRLPLRPWMPPAWRRAIAGREVELRIPEPVRRRCHKPRRILPSEFSERYRRMPFADAHPGPWRREFARHSVKVMDTWAQPWVREVWFCGVDQMSKTNTMISCIQWSVEQAPGNIFYQMPDEASSDKIMAGKINAGLKASPRLARHLSPRADDTGLSKTVLTNGVTILPAWSGSPSSTAIFSALYTFTDELDKCKMVGKEADPVARIKKRTRNKRFGKHFFASTPGDGQWIHSGAMDCVQVWMLAARCPECGELIVMDEDHVVIPNGATVDDIKVDPSIIEYACTCGCLWDETARAYAAERGDWVCVKGENIAKPFSVGFIGSAFPLPEVPLAEIAIAILKARAGDLSAKRDLAHGIKAVDYREEKTERKEDAILRLCDDRPAGLVHPETDVLTIHIDTQDHGEWYTIRGWRYGEDLKSWLVKAGYVPASRPDDFAPLDSLIFDSEYLDGHGKTYRIAYGIIDSQGHRTSEVYQWCKRTGIFASKGAQKRKARPVTVSRLEFLPGGTRPIPGGLNLYHLDTHFHKDALNNRLKSDPSDPGAWVLHSGYSAIQQQLLASRPELQLPNGLDDYAKHFCAEYVDESGLWQCDGNKANHLWDCEQMAIALALYLGFQNMVRETHEEKPHTPPPPPPTSASAKPGWFQSRGRR